ncbi:type IV toxin-antitoxin system AbiEi family antitoxin [Microbacterium lacus]|uniref:type IV toxin-antitoxin system AbiEi family antitoxin n=1 Tax=Microbacterium lacus TaxID=415217 RepID=UPI00384B0C61
MASPFLYFAGDRLSVAELSAARLDGDLVELGDAYIPADAVETRGLRAGSLRGTLGVTLAATHLSAAWIHGGVDEPPARHTVQRAVSRRVNHVLSRRIVYRDTNVALDDLLLIGGVWVTTPERTLVDLARVNDDLHACAARQMSERFPGLRAESIAWLKRSGVLPHKRPALAFLQGLGERESAMTT